MMKRYIKTLLCVLVSLALAGCGSNARTAGPTQGVNDILKQGMSEADSRKDEEDAKSSSAADNTADNASGQDSSDNASSQTPAEGVDVDLTVLSGTMVYSEVSNMVTNPEDYLGKTVKMDGLFAYFLDENTGVEYFACIIEDAAACCSQGIEFVLADERTYPEDYPEPNENITVVGIFDTYTEGGNTYLTLRQAHLL